MTMRKKVAALLALAALGSAGAARAAGDACLMPADLDAIFAYALPTVIDAAGETCHKALPGDAFLAAQGADLAARYRTDQAGAWPLAKAAVLKVGVGALTGGRGDGGLGKYAALLPDGALQGFATGFVKQFVVSNVRAADCRDIDYGLRLIAPLPPENAAGLITLVIERLERRQSASAQPGRKPVLPLCPLQPVSPAASAPASGTR
jgi:hypothetical protein